jgi:hypothetical protein
MRVALQLSPTAWLSNGVKLSPYLLVEISPLHNNSLELKLMLANLIIMAATLYK